ncbi:MAG: M57 family metalloprotease [Saprospiraceae bacterium]|nr:M57 family metalloprotease [Saprospiraceae bacterium]
MKKRFLTLAALALLFAGLNSCSKNDPTSTNDVGLSADIKAKITALGFGAEDAFAVEGGYIVENDIFIATEDLNKPLDLAHSLVVGHEEQYHTTNLVTGLPRTITISYSSNFSANAKAGIKAAIARYNAENLQLTFSEVASGGQINIKRVNGGPYIASAGFPSGGNPYNEVKFNKTYENYSLNFVTTVIAHEVGHCIGFRHTDYMNRAYSCGSGGNEGDGGVGAIHIPGTPTGPDAASWMLACLSATTNRPFNSNDKTALSYLY